MKIEFDTSTLRIENLEKFKKITMYDFLMEQMKEVGYIFGINEEEALSLIVSNSEKEIMEFLRKNIIFSKNEKKEIRKELNRRFFNKLR